jgi:pimeloyl-ACP methyl ester carboxylesterase
VHAASIHDDALASLSGRAAPPLILLHGLWMGPWALAPLARRLREAGFDVATLGYASARGGPEPAIAGLIDRLQERPATQIVAHSLGGLIALEALRRAPDLPPRRVVCLGSPLCGSRAAAGLSRWDGGRWLLGRSGELLRCGLPPWRGAGEVGMIAGTRGLGAGRLLARLQPPHDGTVEVDETRLPGLTDHLALPVTHTGLLFSAAAAAQTATFLREAMFRR